jgi:hypothetical protein
MANFSVHEGFLYNLSFFLDKLLSWKTLARFSISPLVFTGTIFFLYLVNKIFTMSDTTFFVLVLTCGSMVSFLLMNVIDRWSRRVEPLPQEQIGVAAPEQGQEQIQETLEQTQTHIQAREQRQETLARMQAEAQAREQVHAQLRELLAQAQTQMQELKRTQMVAQVQLRMLRELVPLLTKVQALSQVQRQEVKEAQRELLRQARALVPELPPQEQPLARELEQELVEQLQV